MRQRLLQLALVLAVAHSAALSVAQTPPASEGASAPEAAPPASEAVPVVASPVVDASAEPPAVAPAPEGPSKVERELAELRAEVRALRDERAAEQAAALLKEVESAQTVESELPDEPIKLYGFVDMALNRTWVADESLFSTGNFTKASTFALGNVNLYVDASPHPDWRSLFEVRFTNLPFGEEKQVGVDLGVPSVDRPYERTSTNVIDQGNPAGQTVRWGGTILERAWLQWQHYDALRVQVGYWLTPFGIWNVDHGMPTLIAALLPQMIARRHIIPQQLGVQALGTLFVHDWKLDYFAYVSNGRTPAQLDLTDDKAFGGRLVARTGRAQRLVLGSSVYWGRYADKARYVTELMPQLVVQSRDTVRYDELTLGADVSWDAGPFRLRTEGAARRVDYAQGAQELELGIPGWYSVSSWLLSAYVLAAYRLPYWGLEPFAYFEAYHHSSIFGDELLMPGAGLNVIFTPSVQLKTQYLHVIAADLSGDRTDDSAIRRNRGGYFTTRLVLAF